MFQLKFFGPEMGTPAPLPPYEGEVIYETRGRAREYRELACNLYKGCGHGCTYCYAVAATYSTREKFGRPEPRIGVLAKLERDAYEYGRRGEQRQVMFSFTCDPYQPLDEKLGLTRQAIDICHRHGLHICVLTKGGRRALRDLDLFMPGDAFAATLTTLSPKDSLEWEPHAALPDDRMATLEAFHKRGIYTWVSLEPVIRPEWTFEIIRQTYRYVDQFKVGRMNYVPTPIDWRRFGLEVTELLETLGCNYYLKEDLRKFLP